MISITLRFAILSLALVLITFTLPATVRAAPQVLGLVATAAPVPLRCEGDTCVAYLASFCLEPERAHPTPGTQYRAADPARLVIIGADKKPIATPVTFRAAHYYTSVRVEVPRSAVPPEGGVLSVSAAGGAALVPLPSAADRTPHSAAEIARAVGTARQLAAAYFDRGDAEMEAAQLVSHTISGLPLYGRLDEAGRGQAWHSAAKTRPAYSPAGFDKAEKAVAICRRSVELGVFYNLRGCLNKANNRLLGHRNSQFWKALKTGS